MNWLFRSIRYRWTKDGEDFNPPHFTTKKKEHKDGTFVLLNKHLVQFGGKYRCYASNKLGTAMSEEIELLATSKWPYQQKIISDAIQIHCAVGFLWDFHLNSFCLEGIPKFPKEEPTPIVVQEGEPIVLHCNPPKGVAPRLLYWMSIGKPSVYAWGLCGWSTCWLVSGSTKDFRNVDCNGKVKQNKLAWVAA